MKMAGMRAYPPNRANVSGSREVAPWSAPIMTRMLLTGASPRARPLLEKAPNLDPECLGYVPKCNDRRIASTKLQCTHIGAINTHFLSEFGLRQPSSSPQPSHISTDQAPHVFWHGRNGTGCAINCDEL
jgi:hypothetical protein